MRPMRSMKDEIVKDALDALTARRKQRRERTERFDTLNQSNAQDVARRTAFNRRHAAAGNKGTDLLNAAMSRSEAMRRKDVKKQQNSKPGK